MNIWNSINQINSEKSQEATLNSPIYSPMVDKKLAGKILTSIDKAARFWQDQIPKEKLIPIFFYTEKDAAWYKGRLINLGLTIDEAAGKTKQVEDEIRRNGSHSNMAGMNLYHGISWMEFMIGTKQKLVDLNAVMSGPHEWSHFAQYQLIGSENLKYAPCWLMEGSAEFYGMMLGASSKSTVISMRKRQLTEKYPKNFPGMKDEVAKGWEQYLEENGPQVTNPKYDEDCGINGTYPVGAAATEYLFSLKGHQGILEFMEQIGNRRDFKSAFQAVYGISWSVGKKQIANYIRSISAQNQTN